MDAPAFCAWQNEPSLPEARSYLALVTNGSKVFALGGYRYDGAKNELHYFDSVLSSSVGADGHLSAWTAEQPFKTARSGAAAAIVGDCLILSGGSSSNGPSPTYFDDVQSAKIQSDGRLSAWVTSSNHLLTARSNHSLLAVKTSKGTFLEVVAGVTQIGEDTVHLDTIETAELRSSCEVGPWQDAHFHLKGGRSSPQAINVRNNIVVIGGWGDLDLIDVFDDVQVSAPRTDGSPSPWRTATSHLTNGIYGHATLAFAAPDGSGDMLLLALAGQPGTGAYANWISFAYALQDDDLADAISAWSIAPTGQLPSGRAGLGAVIVRDRIYAVGGTEAGGKFDSDVLSAQFDYGSP